MNFIEELKLITKKLNLTEETSKKEIQKLINQTIPNYYKKVINDPTDTFLTTMLIEYIYNALIYATNIKITQEEKTKPETPIAINIQNLRKQNKLSQKDLADILQVKQATISNWEKGTREPSIKDILKIKQYFKISTDYLLTGKERK